MDLATILLVFVSLSVGVALGFAASSILVVGAMGDLEQIDTTYDDLHKFVHSALSLPEPKGKA
jgi:ABC-type methionine transport system permease subunit